RQRAKQMRKGSGRILIRQPGVKIKPGELKEHAVLFDQPAVLGFEELHGDVDSAGGGWTQAHGYLDRIGIYCGRGSSAILPGSGAAGGGGRRPSLDDSDIAS